MRSIQGGPGFAAYKYNLATQAKRSTGSSFKTFVLLSLFEQGYSPEDVVNGTGPCKFNIGGGQPVYTGPSFVDQTNVDTIEEAAKAGMR